MEHSDPTRPVIDFDHHAPPWERQVWEASKELRETCPVGWNERYGGHWVVTSYEGVKRVMRDFRDFTAERLGDPEYSSFQVPPMKFVRAMPSEFDPPDNAKYRKRLNAVLSREAVAALEPRIRHWTTTAIDGVIESGRCDLAADLATPIPAQVSLEWIGMPDDVLERAQSSYHDYLGYPHDDPRSIAGGAEVAWLNGRVREELEIRRAEPRDDVMTFLLESELDGRRLPFDEVVQMTCLLVSAGIDTTTNGITWGLVHLGRHPDHRERLRTEPALWDTAVDELLRRYPPVTSHARTAVRDVELEGCLIRAGEKVLALESSACHDAAQFDRSDEVVLDRRNNPHFAFGIGVHRCVGMHLARLQMRIVLGEVIRRLPDYVIDEDASVPYADQGNVCGWQSIPATFTPSTKD